MFINVPIIAYNYKHNKNIKYYHAKWGKQCAKRLLLRNPCMNSVKQNILIHLNVTKVFHPLNGSSISSDFREQMFAYQLFPHFIVLVAYLVCTECDWRVLMPWLQNNCKNHTNKLVKQWYKNVYTFVELYRNGHNLFWWEGTLNRKFLKKLLQVPRS